MHGALHDRTPASWLHPDRVNRYCTKACTPMCAANICCIHLSACFCAVTLNSVWVTGNWQVFHHACSAPCMHAGWTAWIHTCMAPIPEQCFSTGFPFTCQPEPSLLHLSWLCAASAAKSALSLVPLQNADKQQTEYRHSCISLSSSPTPFMYCCLTSAAHIPSASFFC